jgi:ABC-2 type transport system permease protein
VSLAVVFVQIIAAVGYGAYFPWSIPGIYSGAAADYKKLLDNYSYLILLITSIVGYIATLFYWNNSDHTK